MLNNKPIPNSIELLKDGFLLDIKNKILAGHLSPIIKGSFKNPYDHFKHIMFTWLHDSDHFTLNGIKQFEHKEIIIGCHHYLDGLLVKYGQDNLQVLEHDYRYYQRLNPNRKWAIPGELKKGKPLVIATPFPGYTGIHPEFNNILDEAEEKNIDVHLDCAWLSCSKDITIDLTRPCIKTFGVSLSKGYGAGWNRIGVRFSKSIDETDPITIYDKVNMAPEPAVVAGILLLDHVPKGYLWNTYGEAYNEVIKEFDLEPGNILFAAYTKDRVLCSITHLLKDKVSRNSK